MLLSHCHTAFPAFHQCADKHQQCPNWAFAGQCDQNQGFMKLECAQSCDSCGWGPGMLSPEAIRAAPGDEAQLMRSRTVGTSAAAPAEALRWGADRSMARSICCHKCRGAEPSGSWELTSFMDLERQHAEIRFTDVSTGKLLFVAPRNRTFESFVQESRHHGWPSFRDEEVVADNVRVLRDGETVSIDGSHLGHNLPDQHGNRYCINLVCVAGPAPDADAEHTEPTTAARAKIRSWPVSL